MREDGCSTHQLEEFHHRPKGREFFERWRGPGVSHDAKGQGIIPVNKSRWMLARILATIIGKTISPSDVWWLYEALPFSLSLSCPFASSTLAWPRPRPDPPAFFDKMKRGSPGRSWKIAEITNNVNTIQG